MATPLCAFASNMGGSLHPVFLSDISREVGPMSLPHREPLLRTAPHAPNEGVFSFRPDSFSPLTSRGRAHQVRLHGAHQLLRGGQGGRMVGAGSGGDGGGHVTPRFQGKLLPQSGMQNSMIWGGSDRASGITANEIQRIRPHSLVKHDVLMCNCIFSRMTRKHISDHFCFSAICKVCFSGVGSFCTSWVMR